MPFVKGIYYICFVSYVRCLDDGGNIGLLYLSLVFTAHPDCCPPLLVTLCLSFDNPASSPCNREPSDLACRTRAVVLAFVAFGLGGLFLLARAIDGIDAAG